MNNRGLTLAIPFIFSILLLIGSSGEAVSLSIDAIKVGRPDLFVFNGQDTHALQVGQQGVVKIVITNNLDTVQPFVILTEVRDASGITTYLAWQSGKLEANGNYTFATTWMPTYGCIGTDIDPSCGYEIRAFVVTDLLNPRVLSAVSTLSGITVTDTLEQRSMIFNSDFDGKQYEIEYSLYGGRVRQISYDPVFASMLIQLHTSRSSELVIEFPNEILDKVITCGIPSLADQSDVDPEIFVDTIPADNVRVVKTITSRIYEIPLESGAEEVEIVGACLL